MSIIRVLAFLIALTPLSGALAQEIGAIEKSVGQVILTAADGKNRAVASGDKVASGETLATGADSDALVKMTDGGLVVLRASTQFHFAQVRHENKVSDSSFMRLLKGTVRIVTGLIGKQNRDRVRLDAGAATIGIRGTDFEVSILTEDSPAGRAGIYDFVHDGATHMQIAEARLDVSANQTGFAPAKLAPGEAPLQLLDKRPAFIKGGGLDTMMQQINMQPIRSAQQLPRIK